MDGAGRFSDALSDVSAPTGDPHAAEIDRLQRELASYRQRRDKVVQGRPQEPYPAIQIAIPVNDRGYAPFVTADQQKLIDSITDRYIGKSEQDFLKLWDELDANGVGPEQLVRSARYFVGPDGSLVTRDVATRGNGPTARSGTAWMASAS